jgi:hypothetical protein
MKRVLSVVALATLLALAGCAAHTRAQSGLAPANQSVTTGTPTTAPTSAVQSTSTASQLASIDRDLNSLDSALSGIDSNITQADKAADDDN